MAIKLLFIMSIGLIASMDAKKAIVAPQYPYILNLALDFNEETIVDFITESLAAKYTNDFNELMHCDLNPYDIYKILPLKKITTNNIDSILQSLNITWYEDDLSAFIANINYTEIHNMGFSARKLSNKLVQTYFPNGTAGMLESLNILDIAADFSIAYVFGTDEDIFAAFQKGNYTLENVLAISGIVNAPTATFKEIISTWGIKHLDGPYVQNFFNIVVPEFLIARGLEIENLKQFLNNFNITLSQYTAMPSFKTCYVKWTGERTLGVAVSPNEIVTNDDTVLETHGMLQNYTTVTAKSFENPAMSYVVTLDNVIYGENNITTISIADMIPSYIPITDTYQGLLLKTCSYVTINANVFSTQNTTIKIMLGKMTMTKLPGTLFRMSSPLICEGKLFGLASADATSSIAFDMFDVNDFVENPVEHEQVLATIQDLFVNFMAYIDPCEFMDCGVKDEPLAY